MKSLWAACVLLLAVSARAFDAPKDRRGFDEYKNRVEVLGATRLAAASYDYNAVISLGEESLRVLHQSYQVAGSTPPSRLADDLQAFRQSMQRVRLQAHRRRPADADPRAATWIRDAWSRYRDEFDLLIANVEAARAAGRPESQAYWESINRFKTISGEAQMALLNNHPDGVSLEKALNEDRWKLMKALEFTPRRTQTDPKCVTVREAHPLEHHVETSQFFHALGILPNIAPEEKGSFAVPEGCRTVTRRESRVRGVFRVRSGKAVAHVGDEQKQWSYGFLKIPPDTAYYFENVGPSPLEIDFVAIPTPQ